MRVAHLLPIALLAAACLPVHPPDGGAQEAVVDRRREDARWASGLIWEQTRWLASCDEASGPRCGLLIDEVSEPRFVRGFVTRACEAPPVERIDEASIPCQQRFRRMVTDRLLRRYELVDPDALARLCDENPRGCRDARAVESWLLETHNAIARADHEERLAIADEDHRADLGQARRLDRRRTEERRHRLVAELTTLVDAMVFAGTCTRDCS